MKFSSYIYDRISFLILNLVVFLLFIFTLSIIGFSYEIIIVVFLLWFMPIIIYILFEFFKIRKYYNNLIDVANNLDKKYLVTEVIDEPSFVEGKIIHEVLRNCNKSMNEEVRSYKQKNDEYRDYIEAWVHEVKTPIASAKLIIENNKDEATKRISKELDTVDSFIEQVLYYSRSTDVSRDYIIKKVELRKVVNGVIRSKASDFINKKIQIEFDGLLEVIAMDEKWLSFIIGQIVQNSIKYSSKTEAKVKVSSKNIENSVILRIEDNGCGIPKTDISRVFEKGFSGENGRCYARSTGMGLYICKKLCNGLNIGLSIESKEDEFTIVSLVIPTGGISRF